MSPGYTVKFNRVHLNDGNGYNTHTGAFTAPMSGVYLFTYHWNSHYSSTYLELIVDDLQQAAAFSHPYPNHVETMVGQTVIIRVNAGQSVWVEEKQGPDGDIYVKPAGTPASEYATFAGVLLY